MIWAARDEKAKGYTFNYEALKAANEDVQGAFRLADPAVPPATNGSRARTARKSIRPRSPKACWRGVILSSSKPGDLIIDPFNGTGTTGAVAKRLGRNYIGFERDKTYAAAAEARISAIEPLPEATLAPFMTARDAPRGGILRTARRAERHDCARHQTGRFQKAPRRSGARRRRHHARRQGRLDPPHRRGGARLRRLQRLDLLAHRDQKGPAADRRVCAPKSAPKWRRAEVLGQSAVAPSPSGFANSNFKQRRSLLLTSPRKRGYVNPAAPSNDTLPRSRRIFCARFGRLVLPLSYERARGMPGARCAR